jgi:biopolymer transport protein ExbD
MNVLPRRNRRKVEINIVPLVDVLIVLIFFFLVSMQFRHLKTLNITMPHIETAGENRLVEQIEIAIAPDGAFFFNGTPHTLAQLEKALQLAASVSRSVPVVLMADEDSSLRYTTQVMDLARRFGLEKIRLQSR